MRLKFVFNNQLLKIIDATKVEIEQLRIISTGTGYNFQTREKYTKCMMLDYTLLPAGLWKRVADLANKNYKVIIEGFASFVRKDVELGAFTEFTESLPLSFEKLRWYQLKASFVLLKHRIGKVELAPSAGKTLIIYIMCRYILKHIFTPENIANGDKILVVVPKVMLVTQLPKDFKGFITVPEVDIRLASIYGHNKAIGDANVVVGNIDTLRNYDAEWFSQYAYIIVDEGHKAQTESNKELMQKLSSHKIHGISGMSGTFYDAKSIEGLMTESYIGPTLMTVPHKMLEDEKSVTKVKIHIINLQYGFADSEKYYSVYGDSYKDKNRYHTELKFLNFDEKRTELICKVVGSIEKNQLLMFVSKESCYYFADELAKRTNKTIFTITGDVGYCMRDEIAETMERTPDGCVICAMYQTMDTGVSIKNLFYLHMIDSTRSFIRVRQTIGRIIRLLFGKKEANVFDWVAIFMPNETKIGPSIGLVDKQSNARILIYKNQQIEYTRKYITFEEHVDLDEIMPHLPSRDDGDLVEE